MTKEKFKNPPKLAEWILRSIYPDRGTFTSLGDFREEYLEVYQSSGSFKANFWYWKQIVKSIPSYIRNKSHWSFVMIHNYFKIALRIFQRHKGYSFINIAGLAIGIACSILIHLFVAYELSYDKFHDRADSIYRLAFRATIGDTKINSIHTSSENFKKLLVRRNDFTVSIVIKITYCDIIWLIWLHIFCLMVK